MSVCYIINFPLYCTVASVGCFVLQTEDYKNTNISAQLRDSPFNCIKQSQKRFKLLNRYKILIIIIILVVTGRLEFWLSLLLLLMWRLLLLLPRFALLYQLVLPPLPRSTTLRLFLLLLILLLHPTPPPPPPLLLLPRWNRGRVRERSFTAANLAASEASATTATESLTVVAATTIAATAVAPSLADAPMLNLDVFFFPFLPGCTHRHCPSQLLIHS